MGMSGRLYALVAGTLAKDAQTHAENATTVVGVPAAVKAELNKAHDAAAACAEFATYAAEQFQKEADSIM